MNLEPSTLTSFTQLKAWQEAHKLVLMIYKCTKSFPREENFGLVSQMRRAAISVTSNLAEGFSRQSYTEKLQFYSIARGSITELQNQLLVGKDVGYINKMLFTNLAEQSVVTHKLLRGLIRELKRLKVPSSKF